tara:strand:- start:10 stop:198 length:189 start_codon:yes stop_codon:yes gene_type:complete
MEDRHVHQWYKDLLKVLKDINEEQRRTSAITGVMLNRLNKSLDVIIGLGGVISILLLIIIWI